MRKIPSSKPRGASMVEFLIVTPVLLLLGLGLVQVGLVFYAKNALNFALQEAARSGSVNHGSMTSVRNGLLRGLVPFMGGGTNAEELAVTLGKATEEFALGSAQGWIRFQQLSPMPQSFTDWEEDSLDEAGNEIREIPNANLAVLRCTRAPNGGTAGVRVSSACGASGERIGADSQQTLSDANLLKLQLSYGVKLVVPFINRIVGRALAMSNGCIPPEAQRVGLLNLGTPAVREPNSQPQTQSQTPPIACAAYLARNATGTPEPRIPMSLSITVRMQSTPRSFNNSNWYTVGNRSGAANTAGAQLGNGEVDAASNFAPIPVSTLNPNGVAQASDAYLGSGNGSVHFGGDAEWTSEGSGTNGGNPGPCSAGAEPPSSSSPTPNPSPSGSSATGQSMSLPSLAVGNPIHVVTGNKYQEEVDLAALPDQLGLTFVRYYNSDAVDRAGPVGAGWRHSYEATIVRDPANLDRIALWQADGRKLRFTRSTDPTLFVAQRSGDGELRLIEGGGYVWHWTSGRELDFNAQGWLLRMREAGRQLTLTYDNRGNLTRVRDPQGRELSVHYYDNQRIAGISAADGFAVRYRYDAVGNLVSATPGDTGMRRYHYDQSGLPHHLTGISVIASQLRNFGERESNVPVIQIATWGYDAQGRGIFSSHPGNAGKVTLTYDDNHTAVTDALGRTSRYEYEWVDGIARITAVRGPGCSSCGQGEVRYAYDERFALTDIHAGDAVSMHYQHDALGRLTEVARSTRDTAREWLVRYRYPDSNPRPDRIEQPSTNPQGVHAHQFKYGPRNELLEISERGYSPEANGRFAVIERRLKFNYTPAGELAAVDGPRTDVEDISRFQYDLNGRLTHIAHPGEPTLRVLEHDRSGRPIALEEAPGTQLHLAYDPVGRLVQATRANGALKQEDELHYEYDPAGRLIKVSDGRGKARQLAYDPAGRINRLDVSGTMKEQRFYAADGQISARALLSATGDTVRALYYGYDSQRRLNEIRDGAGPPLREFRYLDDDALPDVVLDPLGGETRLTYDALGQLAGIQAADGGRTQFTFDHAGRLTQLTAPNAARTQFQYDDFGRRVQETSADRGTSRYRYDEAGNLVERIDARGLAVTYRYDAANRPRQIAQAQGRTNLTYRGKWLASVSSPQSEDRYTRDAAGRLRSYTRRIAGHEFTTRYEYEASGRLAFKRLPSGERLGYRYRDDGTLRAVTRQRLMRSRLLLGELDERASTMQALRNDMLGDVSYGNGLVTRSRIDAQSGAVSYKGTTRINELNYEYDPAGRLVGLRTGVEDQRFEYDAVGRLSAARTADANYSYAYDRNGNRVSARQVSPTGEAAQSTLQYLPASNRLVGVASGQNSIAYRYDAAGNPVQRGDWRYQYDSDGRLVRLFQGDSLRAEYQYNTAGERVRKDVYENGRRTTTFYLYEQHQLVAEADERGRITREYLYLGEHPVVMLADGAQYWIHTDHLGTPQAVSDEDARIVWTAHYAPFGAARTNEDPDGDGRRLALNLRLPGQYADAESGTHYNLQRHYDPLTGRYTTPDPLGVSDGANTFAYAHADPLLGFDPTGLYDRVTHYYLTYFLALAAGLPPEAALHIATATQFIDDNELTSPFNLTSGSFSLYHFTLDYDTGERGDRSNDPLTRFIDPSSHQLSNLRDAALLFGPLQDSSGCGIYANRNNAAQIKYQLYGEYLHAFEDTFAHRDTRNVPYERWNFTGNSPAGIYGHGGAGQRPDRTYNQRYVAGRGRGGQQGTPAVIEEWNYNELRTLQMQREVFASLQRDFATDIAAANPARTVTWADLAGDGRARIGVDSAYNDPSLGAVGILQAFNASTASEQKRVEILNDWLSSHGLPTIGFDERYQADTGRTYRDDYLGQVRDQGIVLEGVLLPPAR